MHVEHKIPDREIELGNVPPANTIWVDYLLTSIDFKLCQKFNDIVLTLKIPSHSI